jgi:PAS domain S-box-containing protein
MMRNSRLLRPSFVWSISLLAAAAALVDCMMPAGVAAGLLYLVPVGLIASQCANRRTAFLCAAFFTVLVILKVTYFRSSPFINEAGANGLLIIASIWIEAFMLAQFGRGGDRKLGYFHSDSSTTDERAPIFQSSVSFMPPAMEEPAASANFALLHAVAQSIDEVIFVKDLEGKYLLLNKAGARFLGKKVSDILGKDDSELFSPEIAAPIMENDRKILATGVPETLELVATAAGIKRVFVTTKGPCKDKRGRVIGISGIARDVTESKQLQEERDQLLARMRLQIERLPLAYVVVDKDNRVLDWNPAAEKIFGFTKAEVLGQQMFERLVPQPMSEHLHDILQRLKHGEMHANSLNENLTKDGRTIVCEWFNTPVVESDGSISGIISLAQDITERRRTEEKLASAKERARLVLEKLPAGAYTCDRDGRINYFNARAAELWGREPRLNDPTERYCGSHQLLTSKGFPISHEQCWMALALQTGEEYHGREIIIERPDRRRVTVLAHVTPLRDEQGNLIGAMNVLVDITERKQAEHQLNEYSKNLQALSQKLRNVQESERRSLARELHDELGQALSVARLKVLSVQRLADRDLQRPLAESAELIATAIEQVRSLSLNLRPSVLDDFGLGSALDWFLGRQAEVSGISVHLDCRLLQERLPEEIETAAFRIIQEAVTNVIRHANAKEISVTVKQDGEAVSLTVQDDGEGFDRALARERAARGASLGLLNMAERTKLLGGRFEIDSELGTGTAIHAHFPVRVQSLAGSLR